MHGWSDRTLNGTVDCSAFKQQFEVEFLLKLKQEHGTEILRGDEWVRFIEVAPRDWSNPDDWPPGDGWLIDHEQLRRQRAAFFIRTADCFPVIVLDPVRNMSLNLHCGWKGVVDGLLVRGLKAIESQGADLSTVEIGIGPGIRPCCFEIRDDVTEIVKIAGQEYGVNALEFGDIGKTCGDLPKILRAQAESLGVRGEFIHELSLCTVCDHRFFSHRRNPDDTGRQVTFVS